MSKLIDIHAEIPHNEKYYLFSGNMCPFSRLTRFPGSVVPKQGKLCLLFPRVYQSHEEIFGKIDLMASLPLGNLQ